jgi:DinB family protein
MGEEAGLRLFYGEWPEYARRLEEVVAPMTPEQLATRPAPDRWPIWATVGHVAGVRVYWLCGVLGEPGAENTPFPDPMGPAWEDDEDVPRRADELVAALRSSWAIIEACLDAWTPRRLYVSFPREIDGQVHLHSRGSVLQRLFSHDADHCGELSQTLGIHGLPQIDLWRPDRGPDDSISAASRATVGPDDGL